ncbi:Bug family tripartite tricarboxylate transporter substrate binding protein [Caldovatus aquaticus]|uniref:Tripartite tricarboxylate transporter substrate binding protein n=1 Tax=Caldovatus aquaticus TaxID=2865671 RepID=A0ABS7EZ57_9PROT|nr:tripartite tricarboxylate transporter substrate binding protein [Caldovatus aquaticus]MBW8268666.1 tripartite tricarboxylate transporter substrate binding protein [Caldovatus aquaticus]
MPKRRIILAAALALAALGGAPPAARAEFPERPLRLISGFAAGGASDLISRLIAEAAAPLLGQRIVVENRTGANGAIGAAETVRAGADGHTAFQCPMGTLTIAPQLQGATLPLDPGLELVPVANLALSSYGLIVKADSPYRSVADLIAAARAQPGRLTFASAGVGSAQHLSGELLKRLAGVDIVHVPYRGAAPAIVDILGGRTDFMITNLGDAMRQIQGGELRLLAQGDPSRFPLFPDLPRIADTVPGFEVTGWFGICVPRGTPAAAIRRWEAALRRAMADPALLRRLQDAGFTPHFEDAETFARRVEHDRRTWREVIQAGNIRAN